jgi:hypothetical protein
MRRAGRNKALRATPLDLPERVLHLPDVRPSKAALLAREGEHRKVLKLLDGLR